MNLTPGTRLGPYEILAPLGAGGMGEVYRARDTRLEREVAVKVLPQHLSANPEVRARFEREAKTISSLNHPHICVLFDVGREGDTDYLVMELIEGETLAERLAKGALPVGDTLRTGAQIADALDRAHRAGVVHRDLKPGNIMLTRGGAKLMDFGLARATGLAGAPGSGVSLAALTQSPTMAQPLTAEGTIVGTFQYMSPEQLEGKETDARGDLWAFGCVLYEMATGRRAFDGKSQASLIGAIMHAEPPPVSQLSPMAPLELDRLVRACLVKDPDERVQSAHDLKLQLAWIADGANSQTAPAVPRRAASARPSRWNIVAMAVGAAGLAVAALALLSGRGPQRAAGPVTPQRYILGSTDLTPQSAPVISPDGTYIVMSVREGSTQRLYRRSLDAFDAVAITGTEDGAAPFFSPDGAWIGFITQNAIKKVPATGGVAQQIASGARVSSADWARDGMIYFALIEGGGGIQAISRVSESGGTPEAVAVLDTTIGEGDAWLPEVLPDGTVLYTVARPGGFDIVARRPDGTVHDLMQGALLARYCAPGQLFYWGFDSRAVFVAPFDAQTAQITGPAVPVTEEVDGNFVFDVHENGTLVYVPTVGAGQGGGIVWLERNGASVPVVEQNGPWAEPRISPDGNRIVLRKIASDCELWMFDIERGSLARIVQGGDNHDPVWSPDGRRVAFRYGGLPSEIRAVTVDGGREMVTVLRGAQTGSPSSWSEGGNRLAYSAGSSGADIWTVVMDGASQPERFLKTEFTETTPAISRDGRWIAYVSDEASTDEVFVRQFPDAGMAWQISVGGGNSPLWSRDGKSLCYANGTSMMMVPVQTEPSFRAGTPVKLFEGGFNTSRPHDFDIAADGRFLAAGRPAGEGGQQEIRVLLNWQAALDRMRSPTH